MQATTGGPSVTTATESAFVREAKQLVVNLPGGDSEGQLVTLAHANAAFPLAAVVGDGVGTNQVFFNLSDLIALVGGTNFIPVGSQQFDVQLLDQSGQVVAAWSGDRYFEQMETSFTLDPGQTATFTADMKLRDRNGQQLGGSYWVHAFLTNSGAQPPVEAYTQIFVVVAQ